MNVSSVKNLNGEVFSAVQDASLTNVVQSNSAQWAEGGGGSVSSKYGTISVDGSNIEATNKAIEFKSNGFTSSFGTKTVNNNEPLVLTWDDYSQGTSIHVNALNTNNESGTLTYSSNTNVTGEVTTGAWNNVIFDVQIPNATAIQFTTDKSFDLQSDTKVSAPSSFRASELAWKSDLPTYEYDRNHKVSAINGNALVGNEDYILEKGFVQNLTSPRGTISVFNNNKIEGTNSAIASDVIEGFVSSYNGVPVYPGNSATLTWERYVPNTMLLVSGKEHSQYTLNYSANTNVTGTISVPTGGQVSVELPNGSTSLVIGNEDWSNMNYNFTVSAADYYEIGELAWASAIPTYEYDSTNKISAINGSALTDVSLNNIVQTNSGAWGGSALPISAGHGIKFEIVNDTLVASVTSTSGYVWQSASLFHTDTPVIQTTYTLSDNCSNYDRLDVDFYDVNNWRTIMECPIPSNLDASGTRGGYFSVVPASTATGANIWFKAFNWTAAGTMWSCYCSELTGKGGSTTQNINANQPDNTPKVVNIIGWKRVRGN